MASLSACSKTRDPVAHPKFAGLELVPPQAKLDFTLTTTDGKPYAFKSETHGRLTLLYFGYTHCPDVCPAHMANIATVLRKLSPADRARVAVVFVTTDPERDNPKLLREWLDNFDTSFVGLHGSHIEIARLESMMGLAPSSRDGLVSDSAGADTANYAVGHAAQVLAFTPDDSLRTMYPFGVRLDDWASDIPKLLTMTPKR